MRGALDFLMSVIYSALVVIGIYLVVSAMIGIASQREDAVDQLERVENVLETRADRGVQFALTQEEDMFIGFVEGTCKDELDSVMGQTSQCDDGSFCYCYRFDAGEDSKRAEAKVCKQAQVSATAFVTLYDEGEGPRDDWTGVSRPRCQTMEADGLYTLSYISGTGTSNSDELRISYEAEGVTG